MRCGKRRRLAQPTWSRLDGRIDLSSALIVRTADNRPRHSKGQAVRAQRAQVARRRIGNRSRVANVMHTAKERRPEIPHGAPSYHFECCSASALCTFGVLVRVVRRRSGTDAVRSIREP